jgi:RNA polymerase sigma factor (sigma-70 family)
VNAVESDDGDDRLSRLGTRLTFWAQAHQGAGEVAVLARQQLVLRYHRAVFRYLLGMVRDPAAAEELTQEFAVRVLRGDFKHFDPERGRFRDFIKVAVRHLVLDYWKQQKRRQENHPQPLDAGPSDPVAGHPPEAELDQVFVEKWNEELLARTWEALAAHEQESGQGYYTVLRCKTNHAEARSPQLAELVSGELGRAVSAEGVRQLLHRARKRFAELLVEEVARSLNSAEPDLVTEELIALGLMGYCRSAVSRLGNTPS